MHKHKNILEPLKLLKPVYTKDKHIAKLYLKNIRFHTTTILIIARYHWNSFNNVFLQLMNNKKYWQPFIIHLKSWMRTFPFVDNITADHAYNKQNYILWWCGVKAYSHLTITIIMLASTPMNSYWLFFLAEKKWYQRFCSSLLLSQAWWEHPCSHRTRINFKMLSLLL